MYHSSHKSTSADFCTTRVISLIWLNYVPLKSLVSCGKFKYHSSHKSHLASIWSRLQSHLEPFGAMLWELAQIHIVGCHGFRATHVVTYVGNRARPVDPSGTTGAVSSPLAPSRTIWSHLAPSGATRNHLELSGAIWIHLAPSGAIWSHLPEQS